MRNRAGLSCPHDSPPPAHLLLQGKTPRRFRDTHGGPIPFQGRRPGSWREGVSIRDQHTFQGSVLQGTSSLPGRAEWEPAEALRLGLENGFLSCPSLVSLLAGLGSACLLIRGHILVWVGHWHLQMNNNDPDDGNATCLLWVSHCAQHFPFIISFNFTSKYSYYPHFRGERNEVTE